MVTHQQRRRRPPDPTRTPYRHSHRPAGPDALPVYWMLNISLQASGALLPSSFFPRIRAWPGYATAIHGSGPKSRHQPADRARHRWC
jgi:hypothetical protein